MEVKAIARLCHEVNKAYCEAIGDHSQVSWEEAHDWQKNSAIQGVLWVMKNPDTTPEDTHKNWMKDKLKEGWVYAPVKDVEKKEHPCMVPYEELPLEQKVKDYLFRAVVLKSMP